MLALLWHDVIGLPAKPACAQFSSPSFRKKGLEEHEDQLEGNGAAQKMAHKAVCKPRISEKRRFCVGLLKEQNFRSQIIKFFRKPLQAVCKNND